MDGVIRSQAVLIAIGINWEGRRQVLAVELANRESSSSWKEFLRRLKERGLSGVEFVVSDDHEGLKKAVIKDLLSSRMSKLERLTLWPGLELDAKDLAPLLASDRFPALQHLGVIDCIFLDELVPMLGKSKLFAQLSSLELTKGEVDADAFASGNFSHLKELKLDDKALAKKVKSRKG